MENAGHIIRMARLAGAAVIALAILISFFYPLTLDNLPPGFHSPILALEFSESLTDTRQLLGGDMELIRRFQIGHYLDMAFLVAYGAFLALANLGIWLSRGRFISFIGAAAAVAASLADFAENLLLIQLGKALLYASDAPNFLLLGFFVSFKFIAIAFSMACLVPILWPQGGAAKLYAVATVITVISTVLTVAGLHAASSPMALSTTVAWFALWVHLLKRPSRSP